MGKILQKKTLNLFFSLLQNFSKNQQTNKQNHPYSHKVVLQYLHSLFLIITINLPLEVLCFSICINPRISPDVAISTCSHQLTPFLILVYIHTQLYGSFFTVVFVIMA